jgi:hypothetical protein
MLLFDNGNSADTEYPAEPPPATPDIEERGQKPEPKPAKPDIITKDKKGYK